MALQILVGAGLILFGPVWVAGGIVGSTALMDRLCLDTFGTPRQAFLGLLVILFTAILFIIPGLLAVVIGVMGASGGLAGT